MDSNVRPETMERITTPELAEKFIAEQVAEIQKQVGNKKVIAAFLAVISGIGAILLVGNFQPKMPTDRISLLEPVI